MLPSCEIIEATLPLDKRARSTSRVLLRLKLGEQMRSAADAVEALQNGTVGTRWLEARLSTASEYAFQKRQSAAIRDRVNGRVRQAYCRPMQADHPQPPSDRRDIVLLCHGMNERIGAGQIDLNNLPNGRTDVLARCVAASLFVSYGIRRSTRLWLMLREIGLTICIDGSQVKGLHPDERTIAAAIRQTLLSGQGGTADPPTGWTLLGSMGSKEDEAFVRRLSTIISGCDGANAGVAAGTSIGTGTGPSASAGVGPSASAGAGHGGQDGEESGGGGAQDSGGERVRLVVLDEQGAPFEQLHEHLVSDDQQAVRTVVVVGDHIGVTQEEHDAMQPLGMTRVSLGSVPLLASHCIVLTHAALDAVNTKSKMAECV
jgi:tRNA pseudouridine-54 N-methylase